MEKLELDSLETISKDKVIEDRQPSTLKVIPEEDNQGSIDVNQNPIYANDVDSDDSSETTEAEPNFCCKYFFLSPVKFLEPVFGKSLSKALVATTYAGVSSVIIATAIKFKEELSLNVDSDSISDSIAKTPTYFPTKIPSISPTTYSVVSSTTAPTNVPTLLPTQASTLPTEFPTPAPTNVPTLLPTQASTLPTEFPTPAPTNVPTLLPTQASTLPTEFPTPAPTNVPTLLSTQAPTLPTEFPTTAPSIASGRFIKLTPETIDALSCIAKSDGLLCYFGNSDNISLSKNILECINSSDSFECTAYGVDGEHLYECSFTGLSYETSC